MTTRPVTASRLKLSLFGLVAACLLIASVPPQANAASLEEINKRGYLIG